MDFDTTLERNQGFRGSGGSRVATFSLFFHVLILGVFFLSFFRFLVSQGPPRGTLGRSLGGLGGLILGVIFVSGAGWASEVPQGPKNHDFGVDFGTIFDEFRVDFSTYFC